MKLTPKMLDALQQYAEGREHPDFDDYYSADNPLAFRNRERVIIALERRGLIAEGVITETGKAVIAMQRERNRAMVHGTFNGANLIYNVTEG